MPITAKQRKARQTALGSSDIPAILGVSPFATAYDVWLEKTGKLEGQKRDVEYVEAGNYMEPALMAFATAELGPLTQNQTRRAPDLPVRANIDAILNSVPEPVEAKNVYFASPLFQGFGEPGTDQVPDYVIVQCHVHMICLAPKAKPDRCHVPTCLGGRFTMYEVQRNQALVDLIGEKAIDFWDNHVVKDIPPDQSIPTYEVIKRVRRSSGRASVDPVIVQAWRESREKRIEFQKKEDESKAALLAALQANGVFCDEGDYGDPERLLTYREQKGQIVTDTKKLIADGLFDTYCVQGTHRVLRETKRKD